MQREFGPQPIENLMKQLNLSNHDLVQQSSEQLTHKMVSKARRGRWLSTGVRQKVQRALNGKVQGHYQLTDLFNYS